METIQRIFSDLPLQVIQSIIVEVVVALGVYSALTILKLMRTHSLNAIGGAQTFAAGVSGVVAKTVRELAHIGSYNPFVFLWKVVVWLLFILFMPLKYLGPIIFGYILFSLYFAEIQEADYRAIYILPGIIMGGLLATQIGRQLIGVVGWGLFCLLPLTYLGVALMINLTFWLTLPMVALASLFFNISLGEYWAYVSSEAIYVAEASLLWGTHGFFSVIGAVFEGASPPLAWIAIAACALVSAIVSVIVVIPPIAYLAYNRLPGPKLSELEKDAYLGRLKAQEKRRQAMYERDR